MPTETLRKFAEELKSARESKQITLQQIVNKTKIDIKFLQAIENANYELLPEPYIKAFIKEYAQFIDLDSKEIIKKFEAAKKGITKQPEQIEQVQTVPIEPTHIEKPLPVEKPATIEQPPIIEKPKKAFESTEVITPDTATLPKDQKKNIYTSYIYIGIIAVLVLALIYFIFIHNSAPDIVTENQNVENTDAGSARYEVADQTSNTEQVPEQPQVTDIQSDSLRVRLLTSETVWIKIISDGKTRIQERVQKDTKLSYSAFKTFSISVGNAGAVKLYLNNKLLDKLGKTGEIRNVFISPDTVRYLTIAPQSKNENKPKTTN